MIDPPAVTTTEHTHTAVVHVVVPRAGIRDAMGPGIHELMEAVAAQGVPMTGAWFTHHLRVDPDVFDLEIGVPVASPVRTVGRVHPGERPAATVVRTFHRGPYEGLGDAWRELDAWVERNGHRTAPDFWEVYVRGPEAGNDPAGFCTQLERPLLP